MFFRNTPTKINNNNKLIHDLITLVENPDEICLSEDKLEGFLEMLVNLGHREILKEDLKNVFEDAIAEQVEWNFQKVKPKKTSEKVLKNSDYKQIKSEKQKLESKIYQIQALVRHEKQLKQINKQFNSSNEVDLAPLFSNIQSKKSELKSEKSKLKSNVSELQKALEIERQKFPKILKQIPQPEFDYVTGYFDRAVTPFAAGELANTAVKKIFDNGEDYYSYFRDYYRVGSETITKDIPPTIKQNLLAKTGLILRNIVNSPPTRDSIGKTSPFQIVSLLLSAFYIWTKPNKARTLPTWILTIIAIISIFYILSKLPGEFLIFFIALVIFNFFYRIFNRRLNSAKSLVSTSLFLFIAVILIVVGLHIFPDFKKEISPLPNSPFKIIIEKQNQNLNAPDNQTP